MSNEDIISFSKQIEVEVYNNIKKDFSRKTKEISTFAVELFRKKFWYESERQPRNWNRLEESEIDVLFKKCRVEFADIFDIFKSFKVCYPCRCNL